MNKNVGLINRLQADLEDYHAARARLRESFQAAYQAEAWKDMGFARYPDFPAFVRAEPIDGGLGTSIAKLMLVMVDDKELYSELEKHLPASEFEAAYGGRHRRARVDVRLTPAAFVAAMDAYFTEEQKAVIRRAIHSDNLKISA